MENFRLEQLTVTHAVETGGTLPYAKLALRNGSSHRIKSVTVKHHKVNKRGETHAVYAERTSDISPGQLRQIFSQHFYEDVLHIDDIIVQMEDDSILHVQSDRSIFSSGCYIATKLLPNDVSVLSTLRWFRDEILMPTATGRRLVFWYYHHGYEASERLSPQGPVATALKVSLRCIARAISIFMAMKRWLAHR